MAEDPAADLREMSGVLARQRQLQHIFTQILANRAKRMVGDADIPGWKLADVHDAEWGFLEPIGEPPEWEDAVGKDATDAAVHVRP